MASSAWSLCVLGYMYNGPIRLQTRLVHTNNLPSAELLGSSFSHHNELVCLQQFLGFDTLIHKLHADHRDTPLLGHPALVRILCLFSIVYHQVGTLGREQ